MVHAFLFKGTFSACSFAGRLYCDSETFVDVSLTLDSSRQSENVRMRYQAWALWLTGKILKELGFFIKGSPSFRVECGLATA